MHGPVRNATQNIAGFVVVAVEPVPVLELHGNAKVSVDDEMPRSVDRKAGRQRLLDVALAEKIKPVSVVQRGREPPAVVAVPVYSSEAKRMGEAGERPYAKVVQRPPRKFVVEGYRPTQGVGKLELVAYRQSGGYSP